MYETHQIKKSLSFSLTVLFSPCSPSAAPFPVYFFFREQLPQKCVGVIPILKLNLFLAISLHPALCWWGGWESSLCLAQNCWGIRKRRGNHKEFCHWDFWQCCLSFTFPLSSEPSAPSVPSTETPIRGLQNLGMCTRQKHPSTDTTLKPPLGTQLLCNLGSNDTQYL